MHLIERLTCLMDGHEWTDSTITKATSWSSSTLFHGQVFELRECRLCTRKEVRPVMHDWARTDRDNWKKVTR